MNKNVKNIMLGAMLAVAAPCMAQTYNYGESLAKSLLFYQLQESGKLS